jgi:DNA helicase-2/ATP-dependent DNA helicase PcrA
MMEYTGEQKDVFNAIEFGEEHLLIDAAAGSGKTTTILKGLEFVPEYLNVLFCAFNNRIVEELDRRTGEHINVATLHSIGWKAVKNYYGDAALNPSKIWHICETLLKPPKRVRNAYFYTITKLVDLMKYNYAFDEEAIEQLVMKHGFPVFGDEITDALKVFETSLLIQDQFDFADMIFLPALNEDIYLPFCDLVGIDECQDLNLPQQDIVRKLTRNGEGRILSVGDRNQAIYGFAGADVASFDNLAHFPNTIEKPLYVCFRCAQNIVLEAQKIVPKIQPFESNSDGIVGEAKVGDIRDGDWVICRNVKPLVVLCLQLIADGKKAKIVGEDIGRNIVRLLKETGVNHRNLAYSKIESKIKQLINNYKNMGMEKPEAHPKVRGMRMRLSVIKFLGEELGSIRKIILFLERVFTDKEKDGIVLSTIHKAKGLENERVFILRPDLIPSKYATEKWQLEQERNLEYVAVTRAKKELYFIRDFDYQNWEI